MVEGTSRPDAAPVVAAGSRPGAAPLVTADRRAAHGPLWPGTKGSPGPEAILVATAGGRAAVVRCDPGGERRRRDRPGTVRAGARVRFPRSSYPAPADPRRGAAHAEAPVPPGERGGTGR